MHQSWFGWFGTEATKNQIKPRVRLGSRATANQHFFPSSRKQSRLLHVQYMNYQQSPVGGHRRVWLGLKRNLGSFYHQTIRLYEPGRGATSPRTVAQRRTEDTTAVYCTMLPLCAGNRRLPPRVPVPEAATVLPSDPRLSLSPAHVRWQCHRS